MKNNFIMPYSELHYIGDQEKDDILDSLPKVNAGTDDIAEKILYEIKSITKLQLGDYQIYDEIKDDLKRNLVNQFRRSVMQPGTAIGMITAAAIGAPMTQLNLNTFHQVGNAKTVGIDAFRELFNGTAVRKEEQTSLHFLDKNLSYEEVLNYRRNIVGVSVGMLCTNTQIFKNYKTVDGDIVYTPYEEKEEWYALHNKIFNEKIGKSKHYMRMYFDINSLYKYKISLHDIVKRLSLGCKGESVVLQCIASPISEGIIDIYPISKVIRTDIRNFITDEEKYKSISSKAIDIIYFEQILKPCLNSLIVKGIVGIKNLFPISTSTYSVIRNEEMLYIDKEDKDDKNISLSSLSSLNYSEWLLWLDIIKLRTTGITINKLFNFLESADITILNKSKDVIDEWDEKSFFTKSTDGKYIHIKMNKKWINNHPEKVIKDFTKNDKTLTINLNYKEDKENFIPLISKLELKIVEEGDDYLIIDEIKNKEFIENPILFLSKAYTPLTYLKNKIKDEEEKITTWIAAEKSKGNIFPIYPYSDFYRSSNYVYAELVGTNLKKILSLDYVDPRNTISNNPLELLLTFDIDACRNYIALNFYQMLTYTDSFIHPGYIYLISDFMTNKGVIIPITSKGVTKFERGAFADSSFQEPLLHYIKAATSGRKEAVQSTSSCIFMGKRMPIGTGLPQLINVEEVIDALQKVDVSEFDLNVKDTENKDSMTAERTNIEMKNNQNETSTDDAFERKVKEITSSYSKVELRGVKKTEEKEKEKVFFFAKGPVPLIKQDIFILPKIIKDILDNLEEREEINIPILGNLTIKSILDRITMEIKNEEKKVEFLDIYSYLDNIESFI